MKQLEKKQSTYKKFIENIETIEKSVKLNEERNDKIDISHFEDNEEKFTGSILLIKFLHQPNLK